MSSKPLQLDYERTKEMPLEERPSKLTDPVWMIPKVACKVLPRDYGGGNDEEDSDGEEVQDMKKLEPYTHLHLVPGNGVTELQAKTNVSTKLCLERSITRSVRSEFQALHQWGGHWDNEAKFVPNNPALQTAGPINKFQREIQPNLLYQYYSWFSGNLWAF